MLWVYIRQYPVFVAQLICWLSTGWSLKMCMTSFVTLFIGCVVLALIRYTVTLSVPSVQDLIGMVEGTAENILINTQEIFQDPLTRALCNLRTVFVFDLKCAFKKKIIVWRKKKMCYWISGRIDFILRILSGRTYGYHRR